MGATLNALHRLQVLETQLLSIRGKIEAKQRATQGVRRRIATLERQVTDTQTKIQQAQAEADRLELERNTSLTGLAPALRAMGHRVKISNLTSGLHGIAIKGGRLTGGADHRREGVALGD